MYDLSIVITTVCRESLLRSLASIFVQDFSGKIQVLIGVDIDLYNNEEHLKKAILSTAPSNISVTWMNLGYSTSCRHGGVHSCFYGGSLRSALTFMANSKHVMYLDDDDWLAPNHCSSIVKAIQNKKWAFSYSIYADGNLGKGLCIDMLESVGINKGIYAKKFGGFVRPSGLVIDKIQLSHIVHLWSQSLNSSGDGEDRLIFEQLKKHSKNFACTQLATVYYAIDPKDSMHATRIEYIEKQIGSFDLTSKYESVR